MSKAFQKSVIWGLHYKTLRICNIRMEQGILDTNAVKQLS